MKRLMMATQLGIGTTLTTWDKLYTWKSLPRARQALRCGVIAFRLFMLGGFNG